jgi:hypothetical protein
MGSGFNDWSYWHFFTITVNYNSSHIDLLLTNITNLSLLRMSLSLMLRPTVSRPVCFGKSTWGLRPHFYYCQTVAGLLMWGAPFDEWTGLSFPIVAGPRKRSHSRVWVPWDSRPNFYCLRFETFLFVACYDSQGYGGGTRPRLHTGWKYWSLSLEIKHPSGAYDQIFIIARQLWVCWCGVLSLTRGRVWRLELLLVSPAQSFSGPSQVGFATIFYCLRFETSLFLASYDSQGYDGGIRPRHHTGDATNQLLSYLAGGPNRDHHV